MSSGSTPTCSRGRLRIRADCGRERSATTGTRRFWVSTTAGQKVVSAHRFALATVHGGLEAIEDQTALHRCDVPLCVRASLGPTTHLRLGARSENMKERSRKGRSPTPNTVRWRKLSHAERANRSRHLREQLKKHGWDQHLIRQLVHDVDPNHPTLF
ncbi:hypothetical protein [Kocuria aegyptia]|uniref:HNH endonuclease n=1 Tax=Kocuria aegyptia TaxID=330943 RepID=A0ABP4W595_9MICC